MRDDITIHSTVKKKGNGWFIPIKTAEKDLLGIVQDVADDPEIGEEVKRIAWAVCDLLAGAREELEARL
jgi:hypothetical protein